MYHLALGVCILSSIDFFPPTLTTETFLKVSYNAAGVLSHLASDGPLAWTISQPSREHVLERLVRAITR